MFEIKLGLQTTRNKYLSLFQIPGPQLPEGSIKASFDRHQLTDQTFYKLSSTMFKTLQNVCKQPRTIFISLTLFHNYLCLTKLKSKKLRYIQYLELTKIASLIGIKAQQFNRHHDPLALIYLFGVFYKIQMAKITKNELKFLKTIDFNTSFYIAYDRVIQYLKLFNEYLEGVSQSNSGSKTVYRYLTTEKQIYSFYQICIFSFANMIWMLHYPKNLNQISQEDIASGAVLYSIIRSKQMGASLRNKKFEQSQMFKVLEAFVDDFKGNNYNIFQLKGVQQADQCCIDIVKNQKVSYQQAENIKYVFGIANKASHCLFSSIDLEQL